MGIVEGLVEAREAFERRDWRAAYDGLSDLSDLSSDDLTRLGTAAYLVSNRTEAVQALQRAYREKLDEGDSRAAARCAFWVAQALFNSGEASMGSGWVARLQRLVGSEAEAGGGVSEGYLTILLMFQQIFAGNLEAAVPLALTATQCGETYGDTDLTALGLCAQGRLLVERGQVREGVRLLDEAMVIVTEGEVSPIFAGEIYCTMIEGCQLVSDLGRAAEWTAALTEWCASQPGLVAFTGQCAVHRGQIMTSRGAFGEALEEFSRALDRYAVAGGSPAAGLALSEAGDVHRTLGDYEAAERAYEQAAEFGHEPQPGLALLWLARGRTTAAVAVARRLLAESSEIVRRSQVLPAVVEILLDAGEIDEAEPLSEELSAISESFGCAPLIARAAYAAASTALARNDASGALPYLRRAMAHWSALEAPYEVARCRLRIGQALAGLNDAESAAAELTAASKAFASLGAKPAHREAEQLRDPTHPGGLTEREVEVLRLVASGHSNAEIAEALVLSQKTVARHLSNIFGKLDVTSRTAAAAYAFENRLA